MAPSLKNTYYKNFKNQSFILKWHLNDLLDNLEYQSVLDVSGSIGLAKALCLQSGVDAVFSIDPDRAFIEEFNECDDDLRFNIIADNIENADLTHIKFDIAFFLMNLPFLTDPSTAIQKVALNAPDYIVIANHEIGPENNKIIGSDIPLLKNKIIDLILHNRISSPDIIDVMKLNGYYPLIILKSTGISTVLYTRDEPDRSVYDIAKYIIQVNSSCNFDCPSCYVDKLGITMDEATFKKILLLVDEKDVISFRGGEPTLSANLISGFIDPALEKGAYVILETNGSFIGQSQYDEYLKIFSDKNTEIRLSLDRPHLSFLSTSEKKLLHLNKMVRFIEDATKHNIRFGLYSLGMDMKQITKLLKEFTLTDYLKYIRPITKYLNIRDLPINGKFIDIYGNLHDRIAGIIYSEFDRGQSF